MEKGRASGPPATQGLMSAACGSPGSNSEAIVIPRVPLPEFRPERKQSRRKRRAPACHQAYARVCRNGRAVITPTIRSATSADEGCVVRLWRSCGLVTSYNDPVADFRFALSGPASDVLVVADEGGDVCGTVMVGHDGHRGWLYYVAADPERRRSGIGRALVGAAEIWLAEREVIKAQLLVRETNTEVIAFYQRLGFEIAPRVMMAKWLTGP